FFFVGCARYARAPFLEKPGLKRPLVRLRLTRGTITTVLLPHRDSHKPPQPIRSVRGSKRRRRFVITRERSSLERLRSLRSSLARSPACGRIHRAPPHRRVRDFKSDPGIFDGEWLVRSPNSKHARRRVRRRSVRPIRFCSSPTSTPTVSRAPPSPRRPSRA